MEENENKSKEYYKERCKDCAYLLEGYGGNWICDAFSEYCENIEKCVNVPYEPKGY